MTLTAAQLKQYEQEGFAVGGCILCENGLARLRAEIDSLIENLPPRETSREHALGSL